MASNRSFGDRNGAEALGRIDAETAALKKEARVVSEAAEEHQAQARMMDLIFDNLDKPTTINSLQIYGAKNTRQSFLNPLFKPLVDHSNNSSSTLGEILGRLQEVTQKLDKFDIFQPDPTIHLSDARQSDPQAAATDLDIVLKVQEKSRFILKTGTDVGNAEGSAYGNILWRNIFGGAESLSVNASAGTRTRSAYSAAFSTPINNRPDVRISVEGLASATQKPWASHEEVLKGATLRLGWLSKDGDTHSVAYSGAWRQLTGLEPTASPTIRVDAGDSVKSSLAHTFTRDRRDNPMLPQQGYLIRTISELAGWGPLGGDVSFSKTELEVTGAVPVGLSSKRTQSGVSVGGSFRMGLLYPLPLGYSVGGNASPSRVNDRFQLGGPTDVRGFKLGGLGPHDGSDSVGGDIFAAGNINMMMPVTKAGAASPLRLQLFANGGRLVALQDNGKGRKTGYYGEEMSSSTVMNGMYSAFRDLARGPPSTAVGLGLVYAHPVARFELNFSLPLVMRRGEEARKGLQVGVGINFM